MSANNAKTIYFVRHGESIDNAANVFQRPENPLSDKGKRQAVQIAKRISKINFYLMISSSLKRALETAEIISKETGKDFEISDLFIERIRPKSIIGRKQDDSTISEIASKEVAAVFDPSYRVEDAENFEDIFIRVERALDFLKQSETESVFVVTHGFFIRSIVARVLLGPKLSPKSFESFIDATKTHNTGITVLKYFKDKDKWQLTVFNDHAHLG